MFRLGVGVIVQRRKSGRGRRFGKRHDLFDLALDVGVDQRDVLVGQALLHQQGAHALDGIALLPLFDLFGIAVLVGVGHRVPLIAVAQRLDEIRAFTAGGMFHRFLRGFVDRQRVHAIHFHRRDIGHVGFLVYGCHRRGFIDRHAHTVLVVLAHEDHRQFPQRRQVQAFVELAVVGAAVAEEHHRHFVFLGALGGQCQPHGDGQMPGHDGIPAPEILARIGEVHRAAASPGHAGLFAVQLGHQAFGIQSAHDGVAVIAIVRHDVILRAQRMNRAHRDGFLADVQVQEPADLALLIGHARFFFEAPDQHHLPVPLLQRVQFERDGALRLAVGRGLARFLGCCC